MSKTAIVTGASGNLGQEVVKKFIAEGYNVIGTVVPNDPVPMDFPAEVFEKMQGTPLSSSNAIRRHIAKAEHTLLGHAVELDRFQRRTGSVKRKRGL